MSTKENSRRQGRQKAVLPVRVRGNDIFGESFDDLAHTLDVTPTGARLGGIRRQVKTLDRLTILYRKRKMEFRVVWTKKLDKVTEYQVGLQAIMLDGESWGLNVSDFPTHEAPQPAATVSQPAGPA
jgi:hypothetical protein